MKLFDARFHFVVLMLAHHKVHALRVKLTERLAEGAMCCIVPRGHRLARDSYRGGNLDLTDNAINAEHTALGLPPVEDDVSHPSNHPVLRIAVWAVGFLLIGVVAYLDALYAGDGAGV